MQGEGRQCPWCGLLQCVEPEPRNAFAGQLLEVLAEHLHRRGPRLELHVENTVTAASAAVHGEVGAGAQRIGAALLVRFRRRCLHRVVPAGLLQQHAHEHTRFLLAHPPGTRPVVGEDQLRCRRLVPVGEPEPFAERRFVHRRSLRMNRHRPVRGDRVDQKLQVSHAGVAGRVAFDQRDTCSVEQAP